MTEVLFAWGWAFWLGVLTSIMPCPLLTNIAAISYIGRRVDNIAGVALSGLLYTLGRTLAYVVLGVVIVAGVLSAPVVSEFVRTNMYELLGPIFVIAGMFLLDLIRITPRGAGISDKMQRRVDALGVWGAGLLGFLFALSFCPFSAAAFFLVFVPLAIANDSRFVLPAVYGIGTALPVIVFAVLLAVSAQWLAKAFDAVRQIAWWAQRITGGFFVAAGIYLSLVHIFELPLPGIFTTE